ncbi:MAG: flagellar M-ring protein FliF [Alphaproteobacteria bacterium]|nr:flagellar M-ring protein FliF [Alphaproteobacteria bacterium]
MNSFLDTLKQLGAARLGIMGGIMLALLVFFIFVSTRLAAPSMSLLYNDLSSLDSSAVAAKLEEAQIKYQISPDGTRVNVPDDEVGRARMLLAEAGLPNGGSMGYEIFDKETGFGTTNAVQNLNQVRALEGELSRTISTLDPVRSARVHLVLPQRELFSRETRSSSASVALGLKPGKRLESEQIAAIQSLIASAVPEMKMESVSIIDQNGNLLARGGGENTTLASIKADEMRLNYERRVTQSIEDLVGRSVGYGRVRANVTAELNFDRVSTSEEKFDPEGQVARSTQTVEERNTERDGVANNVSAENNLPAQTNELFLDEKPTAEGNRVEETTNFEVSKKVTSTVRETGEVQRLSVAVLVDGTYTTNEQGEKVYEARSDKELDQIAALVRSAIGFDAERGDTLEVINMKFAEIETTDDSLLSDSLFGFDKNRLLDAAEILTVAVMIILVVLLVLQPMVGRLLASSGNKTDPDMEADLLMARPPSPALTGPSMGGDNIDFSSGSSAGTQEDSLINVRSVEGKVKASAVKKVEDIVNAYPQETVSVIRSWMTQE